MRRPGVATVLALAMVMWEGSGGGPLLPVGGLPGGMGAFAQGSCTPTPPDSEGPFYTPGAPERVQTGSGLVVRGAVRSAGSCAPIPGARIERWQANPEGSYDDAHRASMRSDDAGRYRFETNFPRRYFGRPPHIHFKISAPAHRPLTTQLTLRPGQTEVTFDLVLLPE
ncbi:MAG: intradiol ring-cleavage dioxygenase [Candidatus Methylomirabilales bacterium]